MDRTVRLDFTRLPVFVGTPLFCCIDSDIEASLKPLSDTHARIRCASRFLQNFGASAEQLHVHDDELLPMWAGYLRAALMEYAGMEEASRRDLRRLDRGDAAVSILDTRNAMLIVVRELRNLQVHVVQTAFDVTQKQAILRTIVRGRAADALRALGYEENSKMDITTIPRADLDQLLGRPPKGIAVADFGMAVQWLDEAQNRWGIRDVILASVEEYATVLSRSFLKTA